MHELVSRINEPELCYVFARNARRQGHPELALQAYRRAVDLRSEAWGVGTDAELAAVTAVFAYEEAISYQRGKRTRATGTWQLVRRYGPLATAHKRCASAADAETLDTLRELGMEDYSYEAVCKRYPLEAREAA